MGNTVLPFIIVVVIYADIIRILKRNSDHLNTMSSKPEKIAPTPNILKLLKRNSYYLNKREANLQYTETARLENMSKKNEHRETSLGVHSPNISIGKKIHQTYVNTAETTIADSHPNLIKPKTTNPVMTKKAKSQNHQEYKKQQQHLSPKRPSDTTMSALLNKKLTWLTVKICLTYGITWLPSIIYYSIVTIAPDTFTDEFYVSDTEALITFFIKYITFFDAILAPVIYCRQSRDFR